MPNLMQILSIFLKLQAVKQSGPVFWPTLCRPAYDHGYDSFEFRLAISGTALFSRIYKIQIVWILRMLTTLTMLSEDELHTHRFY